MEDFFYPSADGNHTVHAVIWRPEGEVRAILQIIHGMEEHASRYAPLAESLAKLGVLVCGEDHLGHGGTAKEGERGHFPKGGDEIVLKDIRSLTLRAMEAAPGVPVFIMGHSMGSFFCRVYISRFGADLAGAIVMGTGYKGGLTLGFARMLTAFLGAVRGTKSKSKLITKLAFGAYNKRFAPARTGFEWLSSDEAAVQKYCADELCGFGFTFGGFAGLFSIMGKACASSAFKGTPKDLPVLIVSGSEDPVGDYGKGVRKTYKKYLAAGLKNVQLRLYEGARHEILNDACGGQVIADITGFIQKNGNI